MKISILLIFLALSFSCKQVAVLSAKDTLVTSPKKIENRKVKASLRLGGTRDNCNV